MQFSRSASRYAYRVLVDLLSRRSQYAPKRGNNCGLRAANRGDRLIILPASTEAFIQLDELLSLSDLRLCVLLL
jgi:hypothetical protein